MRKLISLCALALVAAACGTGVDTSVDGAPPGDAGASTSSSLGTATTEAVTPPDSDTVDGTTSTTRALPPLDGPVAPDFTLQLADGSTFVMSEETRPVYLVFWAEW